MELPDELKDMFGSFDKPDKTLPVYEQCLETIEKLRKQLEEKK